MICYTRITTVKWKKNYKSTSLDFGTSGKTCTLQMFWCKIIKKRTYKWRRKRRVQYDWYFSAAQRPTLYHMKYDIMYHALRCSSPNFLTLHPHPSLSQQFLCVTWLMEFLVALPTGSTSSCAGAWLLQWSTWVINISLRGSWICGWTHERVFCWADGQIINK